MWMLYVVGREMERVGMSVVDGVDRNTYIRVRQISYYLYYYYEDAPNNIEETSI